jgi:hypothetical protein
MKFFHVDVFAPHFKFNSMLFNNVESIGLLCDGLDFYRSNPDHIFHFEFNRIKCAYISSDQAFIPEWLGNFELIKLQDSPDRFLSKQYNELQTIKAKYKKIFIESPGLVIFYDDDDDDDVLLVEHPSKIKKIESKITRLNLREYDLTLEEFLSNVEYKDIYIGESYAAISLLKILSRTNTIYICVRRKNILQLDCFIKQAARSNAIIIYT